MKVIIAGGRDFKPEDKDWDALNTLRFYFPITEVVCGLAKGADTFGKTWATSLEIPVVDFPADWQSHGKAAGHIRNREMAAYGDALIAFPGGRGTANMITEARKLNLEVVIVGEHK